MATKSKGSKLNQKLEDAQDVILVKGARTHNLKNIDVAFPRNKMIVVTGVSGSGKSSLTIDTLFAEGQRRYAESLSAYARQFMSRMVKPDVDFIKGLCPAIAIEQKVITRTPRSTVGSMTEIYDYLRLLYARAGITISPVSGRVVQKQEVQDVVRFIQEAEVGAKIMILAKFQQHAKRSIREELGILVQKGFSRLYAVPGTMHHIEELQELNDAALKKIFISANTQQSIFVLVDRVIVKEFNEEDIHRLSDSVSTALYESDGEVFLECTSKESQAILVPFSNRFELDGIRFEEPVPNLFSFNNPYGACPTCEGFGLVLGIDANLVIPDPTKSIYEGAVAPWKGEKLGWWREQYVRHAGAAGFPIHRPIVDLTPEQYQQLWKGVGKALGIDDFFQEVESNLYKVQYRVLLSRYRGKTTCPTCNGHRLRKEALYVKIADKNIGELCDIQVRDLMKWFKELQLSEYQAQVSKRVLLEIHQRLQTLIDVGLGYLTLNRLANSLSGGESQRIQLTRSLGSNLTNSLYILDEPSIGLHARDTERLISVLHALRDLQNTVIVVEHDDMMMRKADHIVDMGPLASHLGGEVVAAGDYASIIKNSKSLTGQYLSGDKQIQSPKKQRTWKHSIQILGARQHNLKNIDVTFPLDCLCVISGVSGSGKTTLVKGILYPVLQKMKGEFADQIGLHRAISGDVDRIDSIQLIDQNPIGKSSRSNPITYIKAYDSIRDLYADQQLSVMRGFQAKHYSFNVDGGRCDTCKGEGEQVVEMQFLADVHLTCEQCKGRRFKEEVLEVRYKEKSIHDVLEMSVDQALEFFVDEKNIVKAIQPLHDVGLGYIKLGQSADTLSGGEAQRVKLASFLGKGKSAGRILFIFDEPTTGLHFHDIQKLLNSLQALIDQGHSVWVIEHNVDVIRCADWLIDLGPEAGDEGGTLVFAGKPEDCKKEKRSYTGKYL